MASLSCSSVDDSFGPQASGCRGGFDFTLLFEECILTILPLVLALLVTPLRLLYLTQKTIKVSPSRLLPCKLLSWIVVGLLQLVILIFWAKPSTVGTRASIPTAALTLLGSLAFCCLSYVEHVNSVRPSTILNVYLFLSLLFDVAHARTLWLQQYNNTVAGLLTAAIAVKAWLLVLESWNKKRILRPEYQTYPPEAVCGIISRLFFWWQLPLFRQGYSKTLTVNDLFSLDKHLSSSYLQAAMQLAWMKVTQKKTNTLFLLSLKTLKWPLLSIAFPRLCLIAFNFCQPFLISRTLNWSMEKTNDQTDNVGYGLIGAYLFVFVGIAVSTGQYQHMTFRAITMVRGGLISMLYHKATDLSITAVDPAASLTLMSADIERITNGWQTMNEIWANAIEIAVAIYLLERQLGVACVIPVAVAIVSITGSVISITFVVSRQALWLEAIERRIAATTAMLGAMKGVKMCGLTGNLRTSLQKARTDELQISKRFRRLLIWNMGFAFMTPVIAPVLTFAVYSVLARNNGSQETLDTTRVFTSLTLFALLQEPLSSFIMSMSTFIGSIGCFGRIQKFLDTDVRIDTRIKPLHLHDGSYSSFQTLSVSQEGSEFKKEEADLETLLKQNATFSPDANAITVQNGSFGWDPKQTPILSDINMAIPKGRLTMLVGPVGCGKSTLLKALLGEVATLAGSVQVASAEIAFCDQTPWHMNETVRQSIIAVSEVDERWYLSVVRACVLDEDLRQLPRGDQTTIGSKGIALSGGQSQRIALARAIYAQRDVIILDDVFGGLDTHTEKRIFHNLLGQNGLLRRLDTTVLIASSSAKRLPYADHVISLGTDGKIAEQGTFKQLDAAGGYVSNFNLPPPDWAYIPLHGTIADQQALVDSVRPGSDISKLTDLEEDDASRRTGDLSIYLYYVQSIGWTPTIIFITAITVYIFCVSFPTIWVNWWAAANTLAPNQDLGYYLGIYAMLGVLALTFLIISCWQMIITMVPRSGKNFHWTLLTTVLNSPLSFFSTTDTGVTINRFSQDLQLIDMDLPIAALNTFATFVLCIAQTILIGVGSHYAAISFPFLFIALYLIQNFYIRTSRQIRLLDLEAKSPLYSQFMECLNGLVTLRAFGWQSALEERNRKLLDRSQQPFYLLFAVQRWLTLVLDMFVAGIAVLLIVLIVKLRGVLSSGFIGVALVNVILFSQTLKLLLTFWTTMETHIGAIARIKSFTTEAASEHLPAEKETPPTNWPAQGAIEFRHVSAAYRPSEPVLKDVSFSIEGGQKIGICGRTGSGKSSVILSIFRMIEISSGCITIDGVDIASLPREEIRSRLVGVPQDAFLLDGSVRINADPTETIADGVIISALQSVQLWDVVKGKGGLDTMCDKLHLSHGQKQLFCLARAMLRPSAILILDEATSSVDANTDKLTQRIIRDKFPSHTIIAVAHRLDTILDFDKIAVMDGGELLEFDSPHALLSRPSAFGRLYNNLMVEQLESSSSSFDSFADSSSTALSS